MAKRKTVSKDKVNKRPEKVWNYKKHLLIILQALLGGLIGVCFFTYLINSQLSIVSMENQEDYSPSFYEISRPYYDSSVFSENMNNAVSDVIRYVAIRSQMEENGSFSPDKKIDVLKFANRHSSDGSEGPVVEYYLDDLIKWGQKASGNSELFCSYEFYTAVEYCDFFNLDYEQYILQYGVPEEGAIVASFETLKNQYLTADGKCLENYADNVDDYIALVNAVTSACNDLYLNYLEYLEYSDYFDEDNTNIRFAVVMSESFTSRQIFTNDIKINVSSSETKISEVFKNYGKYIYAAPGSLSFSTNTSVMYENIRNLVIDEYSYAFPDDSKVWISLDTSYPVKDTFYNNYYSFNKTARTIPWIVSLGAGAFILFLVLVVYIVNKDRKIYSVANSKAYLSEFDKIPIEIGILFFVLLIMVLYLGESLIIKRVEYSDNANYNLYMIFSTALVVIDIFVALLFIYAFVRRIICKNVWEGSIVAALSPKRLRAFDRIKKWIDKMYDNSGVAVKSWASFILFLLFNVFWGSMLLFGTIPVVSFVVLFIFDVFVGAVLFDRAWERKQILDGIKSISMGEYEEKIDTSKMRGENKELADAVNLMGVSLQKAVEISIKDEKLKADLITNVSHDIKTPLTSIINYVDLLKRENIEDERVKKYISVLDEKSQRLKQLTFDLVEASKITSGNISIDYVEVDFNEFIKQAAGEFEEKFLEKKLVLILNLPKQPVHIMADPRHMWRVLENLLNNIYKYALPDSRVYIDLVILEETNQMVLSLKNISGSQLNISADELTERFIRGDVSRSTEGSGLGLSIAKSLTIAQKGLFDIYLDGDLFKITITFDMV